MLLLALLCASSGLLYLLLCSMLSSLEYALFLTSLMLALLLILLLLSIMLFLGAANLLPPASGLAYECGFASSLAIDDAINARFYMAAVLFLLFDLELVLMVPALLLLC